MTAMALPAGATDCHVHVFGPEDRYPFDPARVYTPGAASEAELDALHARLGLARVVLVHPSVYGTDNTRTLHALAALGPRARAVAVIGPETSDADLAHMHAAGVRGVRVNIATHGMNDPAEAWRLLAWNAQRVRPLGWHVQTLTRLPVIAALAPRIPELPVPLVVDHFGLPQPLAGTGQPGFPELCALVAGGSVYVKLSAIERLTGAGNGEQMAPFIDALAAANAKRILFGSDWPHTGGGRDQKRLIAEIEPFSGSDDAEQVAILVRTLRNDALIFDCFEGNPARLYGFDEPRS